MSDLDKVLISQDELEQMRMDASRPERSTTAAVVSTAIMVGAAAAVGYVVYNDIKDQSEHHKRMAAMQAEHDELNRGIQELINKRAS